MAATHRPGAAGPPAGNSTSSFRPRTADAAIAAVTAPELTVVIPTYNERDNVRPLVESLDAALQGIHWEAVFVDDDSPDGTAAAVLELGAHNARVRCIRRIGRRGLSSAVAEGMLASCAPYFAVIDADLQHDPTILPRMYDELKHGELDVVIGSRYTAGGAIADWEHSRATMSDVATRMARLVVTAELADPMSGFFMLTRPAFERAAHRLSGSGFKILLDLFASSPVAYRFKEIPFVFRNRAAGDSKLDNLVVWQYVLLLLDKSIGKYIPVRFLLFSLVGAFGLGIHLVVLGAALNAFAFTTAQAVATLIAMTTNFLMNNLFTYRDCRLHGRRLVTGLVSFYAVCGFGAAANVGIASMVFHENYGWWLSGLTGASISAVWNYAVSSIFTWSNK